jgi:hypothetical protein
MLEGTVMPNQELPRSLDERTAKVAEKIAGLREAQRRGEDVRLADVFALIDGLRDELPAEAIEEWKGAEAKEWEEIEVPPLQPEQQPPKPKLIRRLLKSPSVQQNAPVAVGPSEIGEAQNVFEKARPAPKPEPENAELRGGLPAVIPIGKPLTNERVSRWNDALAAMNEQHAVIESVGGKTVIASWEPSSRDPNRLMIVYQTKESFLLRYSNRSVSIELEDGYRLLIQPLGQWWLGHRDRLQFRGVMFRPGATKVVSECLNLWQGWGVDPKEGIGN